jgi:glycosyltransferase involved in cell wall biosynthesis
LALIFVNRFYFPDHSATSQLLSDLTFALASRGQSVTVLTSRQRYDSEAIELPPHDIVEGVRVVRVWTTRFGRMNLVGRAIDYLTFYLFSAVQLLRLARPGDVIISKTDPPMLSVIAAPVARLKGAKLVNWLQDLFPEVAEAVGVGANPIMRGLYGVMRRLRNASLRAADVNVVLGQRMAERVAACRVPGDRIAIIPNWSDGHLVRPVARAANSLREEWGLTDRFVVGYSGNLGRAHEYKTLLDAIALCETAPTPAAREPIVWLFIGDGALYKAFEREVRERGFKSGVFKPYQPRERLSDSLSAADVHLVSLRPALEGLIVPSKFYGVAAVRRATIFIGDRAGEIAGIIAEHDCGLTVAEGDAAALARIIQDLAGAPARLEEMGSNARRTFEENFDKPIAIAAWTDLLARLHDGPEHQSTSATPVL